MNKGGLITFPSLLLVSLLMINAFAESKSCTGATRIRFKRGQSSAIVTGKLNGRLLKKTFLIGARAGQELHVGIQASTSDGLDFANFIILDPSGKPIADERTGKIRLKQTGDYRIEVTPPGSFYREKKSHELRFTLSVRIE